MLNKKSTGYKRGRLIGRACSVLFLIALVAKLTGLSFTVVPGTVVDFNRIAWPWVMAPILVPAGLVAATFATLFILLYSPTKHK